MVCGFVAYFGLGQNLRPSPSKDLYALGRGDCLLRRRSWKAECLGRVKYDQAGICAKYNFRLCERLSAGFPRNP